MIYLSVEKDVEQVKGERMFTRTLYDAIHRRVAEVVKKNRNECDILVVLIGEEHMRLLYKTYKKVDRVTDVLSFFYGVSEESHKGEGEVFICLAQAKRQAKRRKNTLQKEVARLLIHGCVHVYGYDHQKKRERIHMRTIEHAIMRLCKKDDLW